MHLIESLFLASHLPTSSLLATGTIKTMLSGQFAESKGGEVRFPEIPGIILERVIQYMHYKVSKLVRSLFAH